MKIGVYVGWFQQFGLILMFIGFIFELVVVVLLCDGFVDEGLNFFLYYDWVFGFVILKVWMKLVSFYYFLNYWSLQVIFKFFM